MTIGSKTANKDSTNNKKADSKSNKENQKLVGSSSINNNNNNNDNNPEHTNTKSKASSAGLAAGEEASTKASSEQEDKYKKFENESVVFKAKLIGSELVMEPRGDKMCQNSIQRLKAIIKGTNAHKKRIVLKISFEGVKVYDEKTNEILHHHQVSQISYIASDDTDNRTFGYVSDVPNKAHQFTCFKTSGPAINVMSVISQLFEAVLERKKQAEKEKSGERVVDVEEGGEGEQQQRQRQQKEAVLVDNNDDSCEQSVSAPSAASSSGKLVVGSEAIDLIGDSGIIDEDISVFSDDISKLSLSTGHAPFGQQAAAMAAARRHQQQQQQQQQQSGSAPSQNNSLQHQASVQSNSSIFEDISLPSPGNSFSVNPHTLGKIGKQSTASSDYIFDDLFSGLSDPIIVDKNDSLFVNQQRAQPATRNTIATVAPNTSLPQAPFPIPKRQGQAAVFLPPPSSLPRPAPMTQHASGPNSHNRSLVYNHSSVSLSDAALTRHSSFSPANSSLNDSHVDKYAVFNDIDSLPSIFESASLGSVNKLGGPAAEQLQPLQQQQQDRHQFQQQFAAKHQHQPLQFSQQPSTLTNPFDDDFFA